MTIADRIQTLRKAQGISQEELADRTGVSRQAVSKWESEQALPDLERVIALSEAFGVTTDYLLKGIEPAAPRRREQPPRAEIFMVGATATIYLGLFASWAVWYQRQDAGAFAAGMGLMMVGLALWGIGRYTALPESVGGARRKFWQYSIWPLSFLPLSALYGMLVMGSPSAYPDIVLPLWPLLAFTAVWLVVCGAVCRAAGSGFSAARRGR